MLPPDGQDHDHHHDRGEQRGGVLHRVRRGQGEAGRDDQGGPRPDRAAGRPGSQPGREREQEQGQCVIGRQRAHELGAGQGGEQRGRQHAGPLAVQPDGRRPQQARDPEHEAQRKEAGRGQAADAVRQGPDRRVEDRRPGEVGGEVGDRGPVQPPGPFQVPGPQVERLILKGRVGPDQPQGQGRLHGQHDQQRPAADGREPAPGGLVSGTRRLRLALNTGQRGQRERIKCALHPSFGVVRLTTAQAAEARGHGWRSQGRPTARLQLPRVP